MSATGRTLCAIAAIVSAAIGLSTAGVAQPSVFVTARGASVETPAVDTLDCNGLRRVLEAIDATDYRGADPFPADDADMALMDYENRVSTAYYETCVHAEAEATPSHDAFGRGYGQ